MRISTCACVILLLTFGTTVFATDAVSWRPVLAIGKAQQAPQIDGELDDPCWKNAIAVSSFVLPDAKNNPREPTIVHACYDEKNLYVAYQCFENKLNPDYGMTQQILANKTKRDDPLLWQDDCVELFVSVDPALTNYYQIMVNTINNVSDKSSLEGFSWESKVNVKTSKTRTYWTAEMAIPFASFGLSKVIAETPFFINFCREQKSFAENSCWSPTFGSFLNAQHLGRLVFKENVPEIQIPRFFEKLNPGQNSFGCQVRLRSGEELTLNTTTAFENGKTFRQTQKASFGDAKLKTISFPFDLNAQQMNNTANTYCKVNYQICSADGNEMLYQSPGFIQSTEKYSPFKTQVFNYDEKNDLFLSQDSVNLLYFNIQFAKDIDCAKVESLSLTIKLPDFVEIVNPLDGKRQSPSNPPLSFNCKKITIGGSSFNEYAMTFEPKVLYAMGEQCLEKNQVLLMLRTLKNTNTGNAVSMTFHVAARRGGEPIVEPQRKISLQIMPPLSGKKPKKIILLDLSTPMLRQLFWLTESERLLMFENYSKAGFNVKSDHEFGMVFLSSENIKCLRQLGVKTTRGLPTNSINIFDLNHSNMFLGADHYLKTHPEFRAVGKDGATRKKIICSTHVADPESHYQGNFAEWLGKLANDYDYLFLDHELPIFRDYSCCYCERCLNAFLKETNIQVSVNKRWLLETKYREPWVDFKCRQNAVIAGLMKKYIHQANPQCKLMMYSAYEDVKMHDHCGVDFKYWGPSVDFVTCGYARPLQNIENTKKLIDPTPLIAGEIIWWRHGENYNLNKAKVNLFRRITDSTGGLFAFYDGCVDGRFWGAINDVANVVSDHEDFFINRQLGTDLIGSLSNITTNEIFVLKNSVNERLVFIFNESDKAKTVSMKNLNVPPGAICFDYDSKEKTDRPEVISTEVKPNDVRIFVIKK